MIDRLVTIGEGLGVFRTDSPDGLRRAPDVTVSTGGAEGNVAMAVARLGLPAVWLGRVGADGLGERVARRAEGRGRRRARHRRPRPSDRPAREADLVERSHRRRLLPVAQRRQHPVRRRRGSSSSSRPAHSFTSPASPPASRRLRTGRSSACSTARARPAAWSRSTSTTEAASGRRAVPAPSTGSSPSAPTSSSRVSTRSASSCPAGTARGRRQPRRPRLWPHTATATWWSPTAPEDPRLASTARRPSARPCPSPSSTRSAPAMPSSAATWWR